MGYKLIFILLDIVILNMIRMLTCNIIKEKKGTIGDVNKESNCKADIFFLIVYIGLLLLCIYLSFTYKIE